MNSACGNNKPEAPTGFFREVTGSPPFSLNHYGYILDTTGQTAFNSFSGAQYHEVAIAMGWVNAPATQCEDTKIVTKIILHSSLLPTLPPEAMYWKNPVIFIGELFFLRTPRKTNIFATTSALELKNTWQFLFRQSYIHEIWKIRLFGYGINSAVPASCVGYGLRTLGSTQPVNMTQNSRLLVKFRGDEF